MIPDLSQPSCQAPGLLLKVSIRRDPAGTGADDLLYDLDVGHALDLADPADTARLDAVLPGAAAFAASGGSTQRRARWTDSLDRGDRFLSVSDATGAPLVVARRADVRSVTLRVAGALVTLTARYRVVGLDVADAARLARSLEREVTVDVQAAQQSLSALGSPPPRSAMARGWMGGASGVGLVVTGSAVTPGQSPRQVAGVVVNVLADPAGVGGDVLVVEDGPTGDPPASVVAADVTQTVAVLPPPGSTMADLLADYAQRAAMVAAPASWSWLLAGAGAAYADGQLRLGPGGEWTIDDGVVDRAIDAALAEGGRATPQRRGRALHAV